MSNSAHLTQVLSGLYALEMRGDIELAFAADTSATCAEHILFATVSDHTSCRSSRMCFDMRDSAVIDCASLTRVDVYFKRTYRNAEVLTLPEHARAKLRPYGFNYACATEPLLGATTLVRQLRVEGASRGNGSVAITARRVVGHALRKIGVQTRAPLAGTPLPAECYEAGADAPAKRAVIFLTRLWDPSQCAAHAADSRRRLNEMRVSVVRTLRRRLGERFVGGVSREPYAQAHYPDCVVDCGTVKTDYIQLMKRHLIGVATTGLHGSTGWKLAEYIAAARCIVSEPVAPESCAPFASGTHYLEFETPNQCADACERLLDDPVLATEMRRRNEAYYRSELAPAVMLFRRLAQAVQR